MGLDAFVRCNCWQEGRVAPPPVSRDLIIEDAEGYLDLAVPYEGNEALHDAFYAWKQSCCEHEDFEFASVRVSNWGGYRAFQQALRQAGWEHFPVLHDELPNANGGQMSPQSAARALEELRYFREHANLGENIFLVNSATGEDIHEYVASYGGVFAWLGGTGLEMGVDLDGFFIRDRTQEPPRDLFRSRRFEQHLLGLEPSDAPYRGTAEFVALDSGDRFVCQAAVSGKQIPWPDGRRTNDRGQVRSEYPRAMHVERRPILASGFAHIVDALLEVFEASVKIGNPVQWC